MPSVVDKGGWAVGCDYPDCGWTVVGLSRCGTEFDAVCDGWANPGHGPRWYCPAHAGYGEPTLTPWLTGPEQGGSEILPLPTPKQQDDAYAKWGLPWLCDYED